MLDFRRLLTSPSAGLGVRLARWLLRAASVPYSLIVAARNLAYDWRLLNVYRSRLPVISVGNLSVGGTGKSPTVAWLAHWFRDRNVRVAILSRGYGQLDDGRNDEALELELQLPDVPHLQHADRVASAKLADAELDMQLLLLDDGFQHRRLARDLDIVLVDASDPPAARWLLPGGLMREPLSSLARAQVVVFTRVDQAPRDQYRRLREQVGRCAPRAKLVGASHQPARLVVYPDQQRAVTELKDKRVLAFCAIGNPDSFFRALVKLGAVVEDSKTWRDHHAFEAQDIETLARWTEQFPAADMLVCTLKDWVKIGAEQIGGLELAAVAIELHIIDGQVEWEEVLRSILKTSSILKSNGI